MARPPSLNFDIMGSIMTQTQKTGLAFGMSALAVVLANNGACAQSSTDDKFRDEIFVTGLKRGETTLLETPAAIAVIDGDFIDDFGADSLRDILQFAPGVTIDVANSNTPGTTAIQIRGVGTTFGAATVGFYLDDLPVSFINANLLPDPAPYDLERIEVLKGPHGALYGAGSVGGVVLLKTHDPVLNDFQLKADLRGAGTKDGGGSYATSGAVNIPIGQHAALRGVVSYHDNGGWIDDTLDSTIENINDTQRLSGRVKLLTEPTENLSLKFLGNFSRIDANETADIADDAGQIFQESVENPDFPAFAFGGETNFNQAGAVIAYEFPTFAVTNAVSYFDYWSRGSRPSFLPIISESELESWVNEFRLYSTNDGDFSWVGGFFYRTTDATFFQDLMFTGVGGGLPPGLNTDDTLSSEQFSVYGEASLDFIDARFNITAGVGYFEDDTEQVSDLTPVGSPSELFVAQSSSFSPQASLSWRPTEDTSLYFRYARGFRPATVNFGLSTVIGRFSIPDLSGVVDEEIHDAYELGLKANILDGSLYVEAAVFWNAINDIQQSAEVRIPGGQANASAIINAGNARARGIDWLIRYAPLENTALTFSGAYVDAGVSEDVFAPGADPTDPAEIPIFAEGAPLNAVAELSLNGQFSQAWAIGTTGLRAQFEANIQYTSERSISLLSRPPEFGDDILRTDLRLEIGRDQWAVFVFAENVNNESGLISPETPITTLIAEFFDVPIDGRLGTRLRPRTIGGGVTIAF